MTSPEVGESLERTPAAAEPPTEQPAARLVQIVVLVPSDRARAWTSRLVAALRLHTGLPTRMLRASLPSLPPLPAEFLEQRLLGAAPCGHADWMATAALAATDDVPWSETLLLNATERDPLALPPEYRRAVILSPTYHGSFGVAGLMRPIVSGEAPHLAVLLNRNGAQSALQGARLATPERAVLRRALHLVFGRTITLLLGAAEHVLAGRRLPEPSPPPAADEAAPGLEFWPQLAGAGLSKLALRLRRPLVRNDWWCMGVRPLAAACSPLGLNLDPATFQILDPGPDRFYADPFLLRHDGVTALLFEDYNYTEHRALISYLLIHEDGRLGPPMEALRRPYHLSYPFVFVHDGVALMIPETSGNRTIELYEAQCFPGEWRLRAVLMEGVDAADTTLHFDVQSGLWWMFSTVSEFDSSSHDTLSIFYSERLEGPWRPHAANPVKFDAGSSRPGGPLLPWDGKLFRPSQDCTRTYGGGLVWCEIKELTPQAFCEEVVARQDPGRGWGGLHTYGRAAGFEVVDFKRHRSRLKGRERRLSA